MAEVVYRRYKRLTAEDEPLPQLVIIDGGKGQLSAALESIAQLNLTGKITLVGLAKNKEEIFFAGDSNSLMLPWDSDSLKLIRRIRDEVHRFGITFHRNKRSKGTFVNELEGIKGIGKQTADMLLKKYRSVAKIKEQQKADIASIVGNKKAEILWSGLGLK
jgi:excinuclease ABC subunit C